MDTDKLLEKYRPELRFSKGENFFPMDVVKYIGNSTLVKVDNRKKKVNFSADWEGRSHRLLEESPAVYQDGRGEPDLGRAKADSLRNFGDRYYLQFVPDLAWYKRVSWEHLIVLIISFITLVYGLQKGQIPQFIKFFEIDEAVRLFFVFLPLGIWCVIGGNKKIYMAIAVNIFAALFYAHQLGIAAGYAATSLLVFFASLSVLKRQAIVIGLSNGNQKILIPLIGLIATAFIDYLVIEITFPGLGIKFRNTYFEYLPWIVLGVLLVFPLFLIIVAWVGRTQKKKSHSVRDLDGAFIFGIIVTILSFILLIDLLFNSQFIGPAINMGFARLFPKVGPDDIRTVESMFMCAFSGIAMYLFFAPPPPDLLTFPASKKKTPGTRIPITIFLSTFVWWVATYTFFVAFHDFDVADRYRMAILFSVNYIIVLFASVLVTILLVGGDVISWFMDIQSPQSDQAARDASRKYKGILKSEKNEDNNCFTYARVVKRKNYAVLQYHYFYAFNDYRMTAGGINHHEGDWEMVAIFLENRNGNDWVPTGVGCSQHSNGEFKFWEDVELEDDRPVIFVALGSHANYFSAKEYETSFQFHGITRNVVAFIDSLLKWFNDGKKGSGLPLEKANGNCDKNNRLEWTIIEIDDENPGWVEYRGLWGQKANHPDESGPPGPKWNRGENKTGESPRQCPEFDNSVRLRWGLHCWKDLLLLEMAVSGEKSIEERRKAIQELASETWHRPLIDMSN